MKKIVTILTVLALGVFASCEKEVKVEIYTPGAGDGGYSFYAANASNEFSASNPTFEVELYRNTTEGSSTVNLSSTQAIVGGSSVNVLNIPATATFADGEGRTKITVGYNETMQVAVNYTATIKMDAQDCSYGGLSTLTLKAILAYTWESLGNGQWFDNLSLMSSDSYGIANVEVLKAVGYNRYRIMNPYADEKQLAAAWSKEQVAGAKSNFIEFWVLDDGTHVMWDKYWFDGLIYTPGDNTSSIRAYVPSYLKSLGQNADPANDAKSMFVEDKVIRFYPHWFIDGLGGFGCYVCYLSLPGGPDLNIWLQ